MLQLFVSFPVFCGYKIRGKGTLLSLSCPLLLHVVALSKFTNSHLKMRMGFHTGWGRKNGPREKRNNGFSIQHTTFRARHIMNWPLTESLKKKRSIYLGKDSFCIRLKKRVRKWSMCSSHSQKRQTRISKNKKKILQSVSIE